MSAPDLSDASFTLGIEMAAPTMLLSARGLRSGGWWNCEGSLIKVAEGKASNVV